MVTEDCQFQQDCVLQDTIVPLAKIHLHRMSICVPLDIIVRREQQLKRDVLLVFIKMKSDKIPVKFALLACIVTVALIPSLHYLAMDFALKDITVHKEQNTPDSFPVLLAPSLIQLV